MKTQSAKAKGRNLQKWVVAQLVEHLGANPEDIESRPGFIRRRCHYGSSDTRTLSLFSRM